MFLVNSRYRHFSATRPSATREGLYLSGYTFSRSYGVILPSSLTRVLSSALGYSPHLPESVYGTSTELSSQCEVFLGSMGYITWVLTPPWRHFSVNAHAVLFRYELPTGLHLHSDGRLNGPSPLPLCSGWWYRNINLFSIAYALWPQLRLD